VPAHQYVEMQRPWRATVDVSSRHPSRYLGLLMTQALRNSLPARRRLGAVQAAAARRGLLRAPVTVAAQARRRVGQPALDDLRRALTERWPELAAGSPRLPARPPELSVLMLPRSAAETVFVFGEPTHPLLVCKLPRGDDPRAAAEHAALQRLDPTGLAPRALGRVGEAWVQEGLPGEPVLTRPVRVADAAALEWLPVHESCTAALSALAAATCEPLRPAELAPLRDDLRDVRLPRAVRAAVDDALGALERLEVSVLRHGDTSPQNCLVDDGALVGLVDWELAQQGALGFDIWNLTLASLEQGIGLVAWSDDVVGTAFRSAWHGSPFFRAARSAARASAAQAGVDSELHDALEVAFFARRVARRVQRPASYAVGPQLAIDMLTAVCAP
jgi:hypothetical protein